MFAVALTTRAIIAFASAPTTPIVDMEEYEQLARGMAAGHGYRTEHGPTAFRPPLYPAFLAMVRLVCGSDRLGARLAQGMLGSLTCVFTAVLAAVIGGRDRGLKAGLLMALYPTHIEYVSYLHREVLYTFLLMGAVVLLVGEGRGRVLAGGLMLGLSALTNSVALGMVPVAAVWLGASRHRASALLVILGSLIALAPWTIRNYLLFDSFVPVNTKAGLVLWEGNDEGWLSGETEWDIRSRHWAELEGMDEVEAHRHGMARAFEFVRESPGAFLYLCWRRFMQFWRLDLLFYFYMKMGYWGTVPSWAAVVLAPFIVLSFPVLVLAAIVGAVATGRPRGPWGLAVAIGVVQMVAASLFVGGFRYHFPVVPLLACAAVAAPQGWLRLRLRPRARILVLVLAALACFNWVDHVYANRHQIKMVLGLPGGRFDDHLTRSWMKRGIL